MTTNSTVLAIETTRDANTFYAHADSGELLVSAPHFKSLAAEIGWAIERRGLKEALVDGRLMTADFLKAQA